MSATGMRAGTHPTTPRWWWRATGAGTEARNIFATYIMTLSGSTDERIFYGYGFSFLERPEVTIRRNTDFTDEGWPGNKLVRGIVIEADTNGSTRSVQLIKDDGTAGATVSVAHAGRREKEYGFTPFETVLFRLNPNDATEWQLFKYHLIFRKYQQLAPTPTPWDDMGDPRAKFVQGMLLEASTGLDYRACREGRRRAGCHAGPYRYADAQRPRRPVHNVRK